MPLFPQGTTNIAGSGTISTIAFAGAGQTQQIADDTLTITIAGGGEAQIQDEHANIVNAPTVIDFAGAGVTVTTTGTAATVTIPGGGGSLQIQEEHANLVLNPTVIDFVGTGVVASSTGTTTTVTINAGAATAGGVSGMVQWNNSGSIAGASRVFVEPVSGVLAMGNLPPESYPISVYPTATLFAPRSRAGMSVPLWIPPSPAPDKTLQFAVWNDKIAWASSIGNANTVPNVFGMAATVNSGTATAANVALTNLSSSMRRLELVSAAAANNGGAVIYPVAQFGVSTATDTGGFFFVTRFVLGGANNAFQAFVGFSASVTVAAAGFQAEPSTAINIYGIGKDSADQTWFVMNNDGAGNASKTNTGITATLNGAYEVRMFAAPGSTTVNTYIRHLQSGSSFDYTITGSDVPAAATLLAPRVLMGTRATATAVRLGFVSMYISTDN